MSGVDQTAFFDPATPRSGNCTEAAVATLLGLRLDQVPKFADAGPDVSDFWDAFENFLTAQGFYLMRCEGNFVPDCLYLASGPSSRGCQHMVVMRGGKLYHDPHPSREGITAVDHVWLTIPIDPRSLPRPAISVMKGMQIADAGMASYKQEHPKWWRKLDGTPIPNDLGVHIAQAIANAT